MKLLLRNFSQIELVSIFNPIGYLKNKCQDDLKLAVGNVDLDTTIFNLHNLKVDKFTPIQDDEHYFDKVIHAKALGQQDTYSSFPLDFSASADLQSFVINNFVFDNPIYLYIKKLIENKKLYKESNKQGSQVLFILSKSLKLDRGISFLISDLLADGIPCTAASNLSEHSLSVLDHDLPFVKLKYRSSILLMLEEILNSSLVVTDLNPFAIIACNCFIPILFVGTAFSLYRYLNPYQPHIFCTDDRLPNTADILNLKKLITQAYEFYDTA